MTLEQIRQQLPDFAKDIKLNLSNVLSEEGAPDLNIKQIYLIALSCGYAVKHSSLTSAILLESGDTLDHVEVNAAKSAASIMAMNNIYYRFTHVVNDKAFSSMPAKLRMNVIAKPGIDKMNFELCCLAVSALNGCGRCVEAHTHELATAGFSKQAIQSCVRIAAVMNAAALSLSIR